MAILRVRLTLPILILIAAFVSGTNATANAVLSTGSGVAAPAQAKAGDLDRSFGAGGKVTTDFAGQTDAAFALAAQPNDRLVAAGFTTSQFGQMDFALARYHA